MWGGGPTALIQRAIIQRAIIQRAIIQRAIGHSQQRRADPCSAPSGSAARTPVEAAECHGDGREQGSAGVPNVLVSFEEAAERHLARFNLCASGRGTLAKLMRDRAEGKPWYGWNGYNDWGIRTWGHEHGAPWKTNPGNADTCEDAARDGHLEVLKWARQEGAPWDALTCAWAAKGGHLEVLKWARQEGAPWDQYTCAWAAKRGHLEVLKWARQEGAPWERRGRGSGPPGGPEVGTTRGRALGRRDLRLGRATGPPGVPEMGPHEWRARM